MFQPVPHPRIAKQGMKPRSQHAQLSQPLRALAALNGPTGIRLLLFLILATSLFVRCYGLTKQGLECEELYTIPAATGHQYVYLHTEPGGSPPLMPLTLLEYKQLLVLEAGHGLKEVTGVLARNVHLPFYFFFMHYWIAAFGTSEGTLRLPSVLWSVLAVFFLFRLGQALFTPWVGLLAALLMGLMPEQIYYAQQARMYALLILLAVASTYLLALAHKHHEAPPKLYLLLYALLSIAGLYTHYEYVFFLVAQTLFIWYAAPLGRAHWRAWLLTQIAIALAFGPWLLVGLSQRQASAEVIAWVHGELTGAALGATVADKLTKLIAVPELSFGWLSVGLAYGLLAFGAWSVRARRTLLLLLCAWLILPLAGMLLLDKMLAAHAISIMRYWMLITPALYLLMAAGVMQLKRPSWRFAAILALVVCLAPAAYWTGRGELRPKPDRHKEMARFIEQQTTGPVQPTLLVEGVNSIPLALAYYGQRDAKVLRYKWLADQLAARSLDEALGGASDVWVLISGENQVVRLLEADGFRRRSVQVLFGHILVSRYAKQSS
jgi:uncharacterized membrane protein